jgi:branched-chain amino acid aminotransferase
VPISDSANILLYGKGVFTTVAVLDGAPFLWEKHWRRLEHGASTVGMDLSGHTEASLETVLSNAIGESLLVKGRARVAMLDESASELWGGDGLCSSRLSVILGEPRPVPREFRLTVAPHRVNTTSPLVGVKSCNYLESLMSLQEAKSAGFHEAIRLNERGEIASACMANVFWSSSGRLFTPSLKTGCLAGTTREFILENLECKEVEAGIEALQAAGEIFLTSAGIGVVQVAEFDGTKLRCDPHPMRQVFPF